MVRLVVSVVIAAGFVGLAPALAEPAQDSPDALIIQVKDHVELTKKWCAANPNVEHVLVLPASLFVDSQQLNCGDGIYKLYRLIENDDPDDFEYFLDPPFAQKTRLGCDGKAGRTMQTVGVNCRPLSGN